MKSLKMVFALFALCNGIACAQSPVFSISFGGPTTNVTVFNDTADNMPINISINGKSAPMLFTRTGSWTRSFGYGTFANTQVVVNVCRDTPKKINSFVEPPAWSASVDDLHDLAITNDYLTTNPDESTMKARVKAINALYNKQLGGKEKINELNAWLKSVEKHGLRTEGLTCENPYLVVTVPDISQWGYGNNIVFLVQGSKEKGYWMVRKS